MYPYRHIHRSSGVSICVCLHIFICISLSVYIYIDISIYMYLYNFLCVYIFTSPYLYIFCLSLCCQISLWSALCVVNSFCGHTSLCGQLSLRSALFEVSSLFGQLLWSTLSAGSARSHQDSTDHYISSRATVRYQQTQTVTICVYI